MSERPTLIGPGYVGEMAAYNAWQNEVLYGLCEDRGEDWRRSDLGLFCGSPHATLDHILSVDRWVLQAISGPLPPMIDPRTVTIEDWRLLRRARADADAAIAALAGNGPDWLAHEIVVESARLGRIRRIPRALYLMQMFNHQTHHRAQVTAALHRAGIDYGSTDLPFRPGSPY